jgi:AbrB family looped-hinge helix DNA binding protein
MSTLLVSSKGQIVLPAEMRRRLGMGAGARIEVLEDWDGLKLRNAYLGARAMAGRDCADQRVQPVH